MNDPLIAVRAALNATTHTAGALNATYGGNEVQQKIDTLIADEVNRGVDLKPLITRKPMGQLSYHWNLRSSLNDATTSKAAFYADAGTATTIQPSKKTQLHALGYSLRSDYEVSGLAIAAMSSYYDALADEAQTALDELKLAEEKQMICGTDANAYGDASGYLGLYQLMTWYDTNAGDTEGNANNKMSAGTAKYGITQDGDYDELNPAYVVAGTAGTATGVLELKHLDEAITRSNKKGGKDHDRIFFCSEERVDEINRLLQPQQRFTGTLNLEGGFTISTYKGIPIVGSRYMDKNGATNVSSWNASIDADNSMYLLDLNEIEFRVIGGVDSVHVPVSGEATGSASQYNRADVRGGFFKTYGTLVMRSFWTQVHIANLTAPA